MRVRDLGVLAIEYSNDMKLKNDSAIISACDEIIEGFTGKPLYCKILSQHSALTGLEGAAILHAHGAKRKGEWTVGDGKSRSNVQEWIDRQDGLYLALFIAACNPGNVQVTSQRSIVIHATHSYSALDLGRRWVNTKLYLPGKGYLATSKELRKALDAMQ